MRKNTLVDTDSYHVELDERQGGAMVCFRLAGAQELLTAPANDVVSYRDSGGLWRMGHEYRGGVFAESARASQEPARIKVEELGPVLQVRVMSELEGRPFVRWLWMRNHSPVLRMRLVGSAPRRRTITSIFSSGPRPQSI